MTGIGTTDSVPRGLFAGLCTLDLVHRLDRLPGADEKVTASSQELAAGGPAAVAALTFAALGGVATLVTGLGTHPLADVARRDLADHDVTLHDLAHHARVPAISAVRVHDRDGARSVSSPDASAAPVLDAPMELAEWVDAADVVMLDGHHPELALAAAALAEAANVAILLDLGRSRPVFDRLLPRAQFAVASSAYTVSGRPADPAELVELGVDAAARSAGAGPIRWAAPGEAGLVSVAPVSGGDTLGAGDVLHGAVAFAVAAVGAGPALAMWPQVLRFAADVASVRVEHVGVRAWLVDPRPREWAQQWTR